MKLFYYKEELITGTEVCVQGTFHRMGLWDVLVENLKSLATYANCRLPVNMAIFTAIQVQTAFYYCSKDNI